PTDARFPGSSEHPCVALPKALSSRTWDSYLATDVVLRRTDIHGGMSQCPTAASEIHVQPDMVAHCRVRDVCLNSKARESRGPCPSRRFLTSRILRIRKLRILFPAAESRPTGRLRATSGRTENFCLLAPTRTTNRRSSRRPNRCAR